MQLHDIKKQLAQRITIAGIVLASGVAGYFIVNHYEQNLEKQQQFAQNEISKLNSKISAFERQQEEYEEARKLWNKLSDTQKRQNGLEISGAQQLLDDLKNYYLLRSLKVNMSKPVELRDLYKTTTTVVMSSKVDLTFEGQSDEYIFSFIGALKKYLPGYMTVKSFRLVRELSVTPSVLEKIRLGTAMPMVKGDISFNWRDLKDITQDTASSVNEEQKK